MLQFGWPYPKRKELLEKLANSTSVRTQLVPSFQGKNDYYKVFSVSIDLPKYRLGNGRTYAAQAEYLATHPSAPKDLFEKDLESDEAQMIQHELLKKMLGKNEKDLIDYFKDTEQTDALILTHDGFVVNGNRRLCSMRELLATDADTYKRFEHIDIVILPPADEKDIDELEATLQISPDIKEEYTWYARGLKYKKKRFLHGYTVAQLARIDKVEDNEVEDLIDLLSYADAYLADRGWPDEYHRLEQTKYAFMELRKSREKHFKSVPEKNCFEKLAYCLIDDSANGGRLYETIPSAAKYFDAFVTRLRDDFDLKPKPIATKAGFSDLFGELEESTLGDVLETLSDPSKYTQIRDIAMDVVTAEKLK
ncbi:MAG: hypothetical protein V4493_07630, partial [Pseudomonadota bacterium]